MKRFDFRRGTAVVTGAASGIGEQVSRQLAERGSALALVDRDGDRLDAVASGIRSRSSVPVATYVVDLADEDATRNLGRTLADTHEDTTLLVNNAGVALGGAFAQTSAEEFDWLLAINLRAPITLTRALLPVLQSRPGSHLVNLSSVFGIMAPPGQVAYATSKFALRGFSESLRAEIGGTVGVTVVHPGGIRTRIAANARVAAATDPREVEAGKAAFEKFLSYPADKAAAQIVAAVEKRKPRVLIGSSAVVPDLVVRLTPQHYPRILALLQREK
ncbi:SDR family NAD(P)-dependent oxidoreductase [Nakamurella flava]|uniref:SDR family NAD(P)-dependent oxidoreductase n=1 Tax=Nakamurella flava TaxID=2576308 RepID=A0A4U6Q981_9ACTN|nr:SDR family NAD(P)-dependent oxidoreductase [Nakamurella flava]TKV56429.1 SDR family NAD(P)-dependent oxidoreductase [Nakamurella flava]